MEQHRVETKFGPIHVRVYRLEHGWWPVALDGRDRLPADPVLEGSALPESVGAALQRLAEVIDALPVEPPDSGAGAAGQRRAQEVTPRAAAAHLGAAPPGERLG